MIFRTVTMSPPTFFDEHLHELNICGAFQRLDELCRRRRRLLVVGVVAFAAGAVRRRLGSWSLSRFGLSENSKAPSAIRTMTEDANAKRFMTTSLGKNGNGAIIGFYISPFQSSGSGLDERKISRCHLPPPHGSMTSAATTSTRISANVRPSGSPSR